jgi:hypothetical protein
MKPIKPIYVLIIVIIVAAGAFYGGVFYQKNQRPSFAGGAGSFAGRRFGSGGAGGFQGGQGVAGANGAPAMMPVRGQIVSTGNDSITVKMQDGSSKIVNLTGQTKINKTTSGAVSDLKSGTTVTAIGTSNSDGSVTAQDVMIGNGGVMFRGSGSRTQSGSASGQ